MLFRTLSYLKFLFISTNQHGVHSPFVYHFVTKGLYCKSIENNISDTYPALKVLPNKEKKVLSKIIHYFDIKSICFNLKSSTENLDKAYQLLYINISDALILNNLATLTSKQVVVITEIHQNKKKNIRWLEIIKKEEATVTIDLFYFGLIFIRKEQVKEHFNIRI
tara:strand:- start:1254 stop:1748 length:495 start_codon:yes stop_codon:yes gene_type:complete